MSTEQLQKLREDLASWEAQTPRNQFKIDAIQAEINRIEAEQQEREQSKQENLTNYVDTLSQIFEALFPSETYREVFGINEYESKRAQFYQLNHAYYVESVDELHNQNELALALKEQRIKAVTDQVQTLQTQLDDASRKIADLEERENKVAEEQEAYEKKITELELVNRQTQTLLNTANDQIRDLQTKLEAAQQPKVEAKPSQKLADMMAEIKSKDKTSVDDMIARWNARQKSEEVKIEVPSIQQETPFREENSGYTSADTENNQVLATTDVTKGEQFPVISPPSIPAVEAGGSQGQQLDQSVAEETTVTAGQLEERLARFASEYGLVKGNVA